MGGTQQSRLIKKLKVVTLLELKNVVSLKMIRKARKIIVKIKGVCS